MMFKIIRNYVDEVFIMIRFSVRYKKYKVISSDCESDCKLIRSWPKVIRTFALAAITAKFLQDMSIYLTPKTASKSDEKWLKC